MKKYTLIGLGGSFDHFHAGHEHFLQFAANQGDHLLIGVSTDELIQDKSHPSSIESFNTRFNAVKNWCQQNHISAEVFPLSDPYGPTLTNQNITAVAVTTETLPGGEKINAERQKIGLPNLPLLTCALVPDENGVDIHASRIRAGEISRQGVVYKNIIQNGYGLREKQREYFSQPQGPVNPTPEAITIPQDLIRCAVGDFTVEYCLTHQIPFNIGVIDHKQQRADYTSQALSSLTIAKTAPNPPGEITLHLVSALQESIDAPKSDTPYLLHVEGEEDLAAVALFLLLPLCCEVWYGQPNQGTVVVTITEEFKNQVYQALQMNG